MAMSSAHQALQLSGEFSGILVMNF